MEVALDSASLDLAARLVRGALDGDRDSFRALIEPQLGSALGAARIVTGSAADADDAVQDATLSAWRSLGSLRDPQAFPAWFRRHVVRAAMRSAGRRGRVTELDPAIVAPDGDLDRAVERRTLGRAFAQLDARDRVLLTMHHFWRLPIAETAAHLGIPEGTVKSRVHHAMARLRAAYDAEERR